MLLSLSTVWAQQSPILDSLYQRLENTKNPKDQSIIRSEIGRELIYVNVDKGEVYTREALKLAIENDYELGIANAYRVLGSILSRKEEYIQGIDYILKGLELFILLKDRRGQANCHLSLGNIYHYREYYSKAIFHSKLAMDLFYELEDSERLGVVINNLSKSYIDKGQYDSAQFWNDKSFLYNQKVNNKPLLSSNYRNSGLIHYYQDDLDSAQYFLNTVLELSDSMRKKSNKNALTESTLFLGKLASKQGYYEDAIQYLEQAVENAILYKYSKMLRESYKELFMVYKNLGDEQNALAIASTMVTIIDTLYSADQRNKVEMVEWYFEDAQRKETLSELQSDYEASSEVVNKQRFQILILVAVVAMITVLIYLLIRSRIKLTKFNTQLNKQNHQINEQKEELESLNETKNRFFSIVAHDFRGPISTVYGASKFLKENVDNMDKKEFKEFAESLNTSMVKTMRLTDNLLTWSRDQMNKISFEFGEYALKELIMISIEPLEDIAKAKSVTIKTFIESNATVIVDINSMETVIRNLVSNAIKYSHEGGLVTVKSETQSKLFFLSVTDEGVGISEKVKETLFDLGTKKSMRGTKGESGTGLGLLICKEFVEKHGGQISIESEPHEGTTVKIEIPQ